MLRIQLILFGLMVHNVLGDLPPGTRRNTYLPPEPTKGYNYNTPSVPFPPRPTPSPFPTPRPTPSFPTGPTRPTPTFPPSRPPTSRPGYPGPGPRPTPGFPTPAPRPTGYPGPGPKPTPGFPDYTPQPTGNHDHSTGDHHHEPGMPFDFNYAVKEDAFGNDYSHNAISDGDIVRGEYRVQLPDGRTQIVRYTADWKHGFSAQVTYEGTPRLDLQRPPGTFRGY
ncbi:ribonuclease 3-like [Chelonus insularis]|uniref:ribonuclease 3-like n=1 Tax=Chelonus insularis TaxID=460826 RepID=UPI00158D5007|nr:ribonuclease 3-like [Chelonus insularis]XP_034935421.1 ribonuclease 3-like [Chelonus insularis]